VSDYFPRQDGAKLGSSQELLDYWASRASRAEVAALRALIESLTNTTDNALLTDLGDFILTEAGERILTA
jgi:hypothetical protein